MMHTRILPRLIPAPAFVVSLLPASHCVLRAVDGLHLPRRSHDFCTTTLLDLARESCCKAPVSSSAVERRERMW